MHKNYLSFSRMSKEKKNRLKSLKSPTRPKQGWSMLMPAYSVWEKAFAQQRLSFGWYNNDEMKSTQAKLLYKTQFVTD